MHKDIQMEFCLAYNQFHGKLSSDFIRSNGQDRCVAVFCTQIKMQPQRSLRITVYSELSGTVRVI